MIYFIDRYYKQLFFCIIAAAVNNYTDTLIILIIIDCLLYELYTMSDVLAYLNSIIVLFLQR